MIQAFDKDDPTRLKDSADADWIARRISILPQEIQVRFWREVRRNTFPGLPTWTQSTRTT
jgi:hypothetical protein